MEAEPTTVLFTVRCYVVVTINNIILLIFVCNNAPKNSMGISYIVFYLLCYFFCNLCVYSFFFVK